MGTDPVPHPSDLELRSDDLGDRHFDATVEVPDKKQEGPSGRQPHRDNLTGPETADVLPPLSARAGASGRRPSPWGTAALIGTLLLALVIVLAAWAFREEWGRGDLVFPNLPERARVTIDGRRFVVDRGRADRPAKVVVPGGKHLVRVDVDGVQILREEVTIESGRPRSLIVRFDDRRGTEGIVTGPAPDAKPAAKGEPPAEDGETLARTKAIRARLERRIAMKYPNGAPFERVLEDIRRATKSSGDSGLPIYVNPVGLRQAEKTMTSPITLNLDEAPLGDSLKIMLSHLGLTSQVTDGLLVISAVGNGAVEPEGSAPDTSRRRISSPFDKAIRAKLERRVAMKYPGGAPLNDVLNDIRKAVKGPNDSGLPIYIDPFGIDEEEKQMTVPFIRMDLESVPLKIALRLMLAQHGLAYGVEDGLVIIFKGAVEDHLTATPVRSDDTSPQSQAILAKLAQPVPIHFPIETPFEDVLEYIEKATKGPDDSGIPIQVDPAGLEEAEKTMTSPVSLDLEGVPLRETLRLILREIGLVFYVKDGVLTISTEKLVEARR